MTNGMGRWRGPHGRRVRRLGPQVVRIAAPRDLVFAQIAVPYRSANPPRDLRDKIEVLDRSADAVVAAHRTRIGRLTVVTVESVSFLPPDEIRFRLLRGPVPAVSERFLLRETADGATQLEYTGELGTDLWAAGQLWGSIVARYWERTVATALRALKTSAETMAGRAAARRLADARADRGERLSDS